MSARPPVVNQFLSDLVYGDAVSTDCLVLDRLLRKLGYPGAIYVQRTDSFGAKLTRPFREHVPSEGEIVLFHYSVWSEVAKYVRSLRSSRLVLIYHNITPPEFFKGVNDQAEEDTRLGLAELPGFAPGAALALGKSEFSRRELVAAGFRETGVLPVAVNFQELNSKPNEALYRQYDDAYVNFLAVGRVVPNKRVEDVVKTFYHFKRQHNPRSRLFIVGSKYIVGEYLFWIDRLAARLGIHDDVHFTGQVPQADLNAFYRLADVFFSLSEHEGFCVPLVEAMHLGVPVIAYGAAAVPETLGAGGILVNHKQFAGLAELANLVVSDADLRQRLIAAGHRRAAEFDSVHVERRLQALLGQVVSQLAA